MKKLLVSALLLASTATFGVNCVKDPVLSSGNTDVYKQTGLDLNDTNTISCEVDLSNAVGFAVEIDVVGTIGAAEIQTQISVSGLSTNFGSRGATITSERVEEYEPFYARKARVKVAVAKGSPETFTVFFSRKRMTVGRSRD